MNETMKVIFGLVGGLAIFIYGMNMMSECLQKAAGEKMKSILSMLTKNPVLGVLAGALTTAVLQSSSATTVMAIGFVSAGLMSLPQAISIILGANIGTTMTAQIIAFKISDYIYLFIFVGFIIAFISKKEKVKNIGQTIFAFGLLFLGIETMGSVMKPLASSAFFVDLIGKVSTIPVLSVGVGALMTLVAQMLDKIRTRGGKNEAEVDAFVQEHAKSLQALNTSINDYLASMYSEGVLNEEQAAQSAGMLYILCDIDRIGQLALDITVNLQVQNKGKHKYSKEAVKELKKAIDQICTIYRESIQRISGDDDITIQDVQSQKESIMNLDEKIRKNHIFRVGKGKCDSKLTAPFNEVLHNIERIGNSCVNLVEVAEDKAIMQSLLAED